MTHNRAMRLYQNFLKKRSVKIFILLVSLVKDVSMTHFFAVSYVLVEVKTVY